MSNNKRNKPVHSPAFRSQSTPDTDWLQSVYNSGDPHKAALLAVQYGAVPPTTTTKIFAATDAATIQTLDAFAAGYSEREFKTILEIQREHDVSLEDAIEMHRWWNGKRVP